MPLSPFTVVDCISLTPDKLVVYPKFFRNIGVERKYSYAKPEKVVTALPESNKHSFELSKQAQKNLRQKVTWLYHFAKKKTVITRKGKQLTNFRMNFATLKLPSEQIHSSDFITKNCLNQLFVEISKKYKFENYVWRLEYQKNGNLHYHIATDTYIDYFFLQRAWNRILNKYGYVDMYQRKFSQMSLNDYVKSQNYSAKTDFKVLSERYALGCRENWKNPNSVDVKAVFGKSNIAFYISKYMAKSKDEKEAVALPVCELNSRNSRLWFCSRSLSKCVSVADIREAMEIDLYGILLRCEKVKRVVHDYCTILYFSFSDLPALVKGVLNRYFDDYRQEVGYLPV